MCYTNKTESDTNSQLKPLLFVEKAPLIALPLLWQDCRKSRLVQFLTHFQCYKNLFSFLSRTSMIPTPLEERNQYDRVC